MKFIDLTGEIFGLWTVLERDISQDSMSNRRPMPVGDARKTRWDKGVKRAPPV
jgi:hypothetical protein